MKIALSEHAKLRCKQSNINVAVLLKDLRDIPPFKTTLRWVTRCAVVIMLRLKDGSILLKTVIHKEKSKYSGATARKHSAFTVYSH